MSLSFKGHTVVVTGAGGGLGKTYVFSSLSITGLNGGPYSYSHLFASRGANVVVNDVSSAAAQKVVDEIVKGLSAFTFLKPSLEANRII
jgi:multifunctional beta-oxidation protein